MAICDMDNELDEMAFWKWQAVYHYAVRLLPYDRRDEEPTPQDVKQAFDDLKDTMVDEKEEGGENWPYMTFRGKGF